MVWIKICGITDLGDAEKVSELDVDAVGFILSTDSPRRIDNSRAKKLIRSVRKNNKKISLAGVFVNERIEKVLMDSVDLGLDMVQLSGNENRDYLKTLYSKSSGVKIIKAVRIKNGPRSCRTELSKEIQKIKEYADFILLDSYSKNVYGGTGISFDWNMAVNCDLAVPIILSGGLDPENVEEAVKKAKPFGVDASSKLEVYPGKKDISKVSEFVRILRSMEQEGK
jgi:phosphoribosylanthranilate isomerase